MKMEHLHEMECFHEWWKNPFLKFIVFSGACELLLLGWIKNSSSTGSWHFFLFLFFKSLNFPLNFHGVCIHTAYVWGTFAVPCPREFCGSEQQHKFRVTQMKKHVSIVYTGKKKGCCLPLNICSHMSFCKQQDHFNHRHFYLCSETPITCQVLHKVYFTYFIVWLCQIVLSSTGWKHRKALTALTRCAQSLNILVPSVMYTGLNQPSPVRGHKCFRCLLKCLHRLLGWYKKRQTTWMAYTFNI